MFCSRRYLQIDIITKQISTVELLIDSANKESGDTDSNDVSSIFYLCKALKKLK